MIAFGFWGILLIVSLYILVKAADHFTDSAEELGLYLGMPAFLVGVTIVAIGTSLPELVSSVIAVMKGASEFVAGNVVGSNVANIFLILGITAIVGKKLKVSYDLVHVDLPLLMGSVFIFALTIYDGVFTLVEAFICLAGMLIYIIYVIKSQRDQSHEARELKKELKKGLKEEKRVFNKRDIVILIVSAVFIYIGARFTVESVLNLSELFNIGKEIIALSAVALGTSLPELAVSIKAARKGQPEIAVGNILGSNIFNVFAVMGVSGLFGALIIPQNIIGFGLPVMIIATLLYYFITQDKEITLWEGLILIIFYILFIGKVFLLF